MILNIWQSSNLESLWYILPELLLLGGAFGFLTMSLFTPHNRRNILAWAILILLTSLFMAMSGVGTSAEGRVGLFSGLLVVDAFSMYAKVFFILSSMIASFFFYQSKTFGSTKKLLETLAFLMVLTVGLCWMAMSVDLLMTFISLEMVSILSYLLVASKPKDAFSSEAGLKYILFGAVASGIMLFGLSFLFGMVGASDYAAIARHLQGDLHTTEILVLFFSFICILVGFGFKMTIFPTQMWVPDVYQGAPTSVTAFLSVSSKAGGFLIFMRLLIELKVHLGSGAFESLIAQIKMHEILVFFGVMSMIIGNVSALKQKNLKRLMAYSSIAHAGFILLGLSCLGQDGFFAVLFYLFVYMLMNFGAFYIIHLRVIDTGNDHIDSFRGYGNQNIWMSVSMTIFLLSMIGLPPFSGFIAKFYVFKSLLSQKYYMTALLGGINTAIAVYYYMKIIKWMFLKDGNDPEIPRYGKLARVYVILLLVPVISLGIYWKPLIDWVEASLSFVF
ncbi:MAG: NADH-quinone oxidoreductase subunit N [Deltaproteobacteria bacterium]|nr:NADH-quinone oxidoreductase subunit N [Deltaproteobacteria bacterium]